MRTKIYLSTLLFLCVTFFSNPLQAQFEGHISMNLYGDNENGKTSVNQLNMYVTADRIFLKGEDEMNFGQSFNSGGMLIRNDKKDFVVLMENNDALQVTKSEVEGLFKMFLSWGSDSSPNSSENEEMNFEYTDRERTINGYKTYELVISGKEADSKMSVWLTPNIDINWGMLAEPWKNIPAEANRAVNQSRDAVFTGKNFPMLVEVTGKKGTETVMEVTNINKSSIAKAMVQVPTGVNLISVTDLMFKMMSGN
jgi:hypothetical protein